jgi:hypothetical protein
MAEIKAKQGKSRAQARVSTTDAQATVMKMADGGYRPAYNGQFASDTETQVVVGVEAVCVGTDMAQLTPMVEQVETRYGQSPAEWLVDGGYPAHEQIDQAAEHTKVFNVKETRSQPSRALTTEDHVRIRRSPSQALAVILAVI